MSVYTNKRLEQIENEQKNIPITKDMYEFWLQNDVTRMFLLDMEGLLIQAQSDRAYGSTVEQIAITELKRSTTAATYELILEWNPITDSE